MQVLILGVGDAFTKRHFNTSALIEHGGRYILLDCPTPISRVLQDATSISNWKIGLESIDNIIITHLHGDHCSGLEAFGFWRYFYSKSNNKSSLPCIHTNQLAADRLWERFAPAMDRANSDSPATLSDYYNLKILTPDAESQVCGLSVKCRFTGHPVPTVGLLISDGSATLGWSSDTPYDEEHIKWLSDADVIVHESGPAPSHTPIEDLNALPDELKAKIRLIHLDDDFDYSSTDIKPLQEGEVIEF